MLSEVMIDKSTSFYDAASTFQECHATIVDLWFHPNHITVVVHTNTLNDATDLAICLSNNDKELPEITFPPQFVAKDDGPGEGTEV